MKYFKLLFYLIYISIGTLTISAQTKFTISGVINDRTSGKAIIGGLVINKNQKNVGVSTNAYGFYAISLAQGNYMLSFTSFGFEIKGTLIELDQNVKLNMELFEKAVDLKEVEVAAEKSNNNIPTAQISAEKLNVKEVAKIPVFLAKKIF